MYQMSQSHCSSCAGRGISYSPLESVISGSSVSYESRTSFGNGYNFTPPGSYQVSFTHVTSFSYSSSSSPLSYKAGTLNYSVFQSQQNYDFLPDDFLKPGKLGMFVGKAEEIR